MRTGAGFAEGVVEAMRGDHESAAEKGDSDFREVVGKTISGIGREEDAEEAGCHETENTNAAVGAESAEKRDGAEEGDEEGKAAMNTFFGWEQMGEYGGGGEQKRRQQAVDDAEAGSPDAETIRPDGSSGNRDRVFTRRAHDDSLS